MSKSQKNVEIKKEEGVELESQFILRLIDEPARALRDAIQSGNLKDRLLIKLEQDIRYGEVRFDDFLLHGKIVDLPTVIESLKTIDNKSFYKTADICQIMICSEEAEPPAVEEESPNKAKKKDPNKVDKKFLWPHGVTPPCKNIRKRRFRKTLKKKYVEAPEIEKEVKRLLRIDNDAVNVTYEIINEDDENLKSDQLDNPSKEQTFNETDEDKLDDSFSREQTNKIGNETIDSDVEQDGLIERPSNLHEHDIHDIFGGEVSSSDDEGNHHHQDKLQDISRFSADDSHLSDYSMGRNDEQNKRLTEFNKSMFDGTSKENLKDYIDHEIIIDSNDQDISYYGDGNDKNLNKQIDYDYIGQHPQMTKEEINTKILELRKQCEDLKVLQNQKSNEVSSISNQTLKQRLQETVDNLIGQIVEKEMEIQDYHNLLQSIASGSN